MHEDGKKVPDSVIIKKLKECRNTINFQNDIGCKPSSAYFKQEYRFIINHKKIYRLCKENNLLLRKKKKYKRHKKIACNLKVNAPNQLWQFDIKYGYIHGEDRTFYFLAFIDVFTKKIVGYHVGVSCNASDIKLTLRAALNKLGSVDRENFNHSL